PVVVGLGLVVGVGGLGGRLLRGSLVGRGGLLRLLPGRLWLGRARRLAGLEGGLGRRVGFGGALVGALLLVGGRGLSAHDCSISIGWGFCAWCGWSGPA